jgi:predicted Fe-Mo cluster-binding NifX family protein
LGGISAWGEEVAKGGEGGMDVRIVVPVSEERGIDSRLAEHFGRAPYYAIIDLDNEGNVIDQGTVANRSEHFGGVGHPPDRIIQLQPRALITYGMGPRALRIFQSAKVAVLKTNVNTVREAVKAYNNNELEELTQGCRHAQHP